MAAEILGLLRKRPAPGYEHRAIKRHPNYTGAFPDPILKKLGMSQEAQESLINANDSKRQNFTEIAGLIRSGVADGFPV